MGMSVYQFAVPLERAPGIYLFIYLFICASSNGLAVENVYINDRNIRVSLYLLSRPKLLM